MTRKKKTQEKSNSMSKGIRACTVVLHDIALDTDLIQRYQLHLPLKKEQFSKQSASCINTSLHSNISTDKQLIKENARKKNATKNEKYTITKNSKKERKDYKKIKSQQRNGKEINKNISLNHQYYEATPKFILSKFIAPEQQLIHHSNVESFSSTNTDETSSTTSTDTHFTYMQKMTILLNNKNVRRPNTEENKKLDSKRILNLNKPDETCNADIKSITMGSNDANCLDKKNLTVTDYNSNMQEMSSKSITYKQCNNNLHPFNFSDEMKIKQELYKKSQNNKDNIVQTTCGGKSSKNETIRQNLPKIIANSVLPKGIKILKGVKIEKLRINNSLQSNIPTQISLEQDVKTRCNNDKSIAQTFCNDTAETITTIENIREKKHISHEINESFDTLKISSLLNNINVDLKDKDLSNNKSHSKVIDYRNLNSATKIRNNGDISINNFGEIIMTHENYTLSNQEQLNRFTNNIEIHENNILQDNRKCEEKCTKNILNKNVSDLMDIDDENYISTSSILASKEGNILLKETLKRTLEEEDCSQDSKKIKLNRNSWLQSNIAFKSNNYQQDNDSLNSVTTNTTVETNKTKKYNQEERPDLRKFLNEMRSEKSFKLKPTVEIADEEVCKKISVKEESTLNETLYEKKSDAQEKPSSSIASDDEDDDCISLFAESFAEFDTSQCEDISLNEKNKSSKSLHSDVPYTMTASSFDKYVKENNKEFNKEYAKCIENDAESLKSDKANEISNNQSTQVLNTYCVPATAIQSKSPQTKNIYSKKKTLFDFVKGYCYLVLKCGTCYKSHYQCKFNHDIKEIFQIINSEDTRTILDIMPEALTQNFNYFCEEVYIALLEKLNIDEILITYKMLYNNWNVNWRREFTKWSRRNIASNIIEELLNRQISLKTIVDCMMTHILPTKNLRELNNILLTVDKYVKPGEYWNTTRNLILTLQSNVPKHIIDHILYECVRSKELQKIQDVNSNLINKLDSTLISTLDQYVMKCFKSMLVEKTAKNSEVLTQNFGESLITTETIASPDSPDPSPSINFTQQEPPIKYDVSSINNETDVNQNENHITQDVNVPKPYVYGFMQPINAPYARSMYRDHERFWKFYMDLERFEKGLIHEDYNYIIDILKSYTEKRESELFVSKCCLILRNIKRSEYHLKNILTLTVQIGIFSILGKILLDIGLNILTSLVDEEAWGVALQFIQLLNIYNLPYNAKYFLLSAEIYLANNKAVKAYDLLKYQNIICTSRDRWHVYNTINDEYVRNKIICILLDSFCNEFLEYAFFLFQFLLKDQSSYYNPIDLSRYVDKLIVLSLSKNDTNLITEMSNVILKHNFALSTTTCRALLSTIIHIDDVLARQIYNYAEGMGIYSTMKLLPIIHTIINTDLTEEEIYLIFLQLLKYLIMNFGHAIEFAKPREIKVYFILEIKTNKQFYCAALQSHYNNKAIMNAKALIKNVLKKRFDPPILLMKSNVKDRIGKLQSTSLINYLKSEHCN